MRKPIAILLALMLLVFNTGLALNQHLCLGKLMGISLSLGHEKMGCAMAQDELPCSQTQKVQNKCCQTLSFNVQLKDNIVKAAAEKLISSGLAVFKPVLHLLFTPEPSSGMPALAYLSPPEVSHVSLPDIGVFRI